MVRQDEGNAAEDESSCYEHYILKKSKSRVKTNLSINSSEGDQTIVWLEGIEFALQEIEYE